MDGIDHSHHGKGTATYIGCIISNSVLEKILTNIVNNAGLWGEAQKLNFPIITYLFSYFSNPGTVNYTFGRGHELLLDKAVKKNSVLELEPWGMRIIEEQ